MEVWGCVRFAERTGMPASLPQPARGGLASAAAAAAVEARRSEKTKSPPPRQPTPQQQQHLKQQQQPQPQQQQARIAVVSAAARSRSMYKTEQQLEQVLQETQKQRPHQSQQQVQPQMQQQSGAARRPTVSASQQQQISRAGPLEAGKARALPTEELLEVDRGERVRCLRCGCEPRLWLPLARSKSCSASAAVERHRRRASAPRLAERANRSEETRTRSAPGAAAAVVPPTESGTSVLLGEDDEEGCRLPGSPVLSTPRFPPCACFEADSAQRAELARRSVYPAGNNVAPCLPFLQRGICYSYERFGWCNFSHPSAETVLDLSFGAVERCSVCTLPTPCWVHFPVIGAALHGAELARLELSHERLAELGLLELPAPPSSIDASSDSQAEQQQFPAPSESRASEDAMTVARKQFVLKEHEIVAVPYREALCYAIVVEDQPELGLCNILVRHKQEAPKSITLSRKKVVKVRGRIYRGQLL